MSEDDLGEEYEEEFFVFDHKYKPQASPKQILKDISQDEWQNLSIHIDFKLDFSDYLCHSDIKMFRKLHSHIDIWHNT